MKNIKALLISFLLIALNAAQIFSRTVIVVGKKASAAGSVIISQTDNGDGRRIRVFPAKDYK